MAATKNSAGLFWVESLDRPNRKPPIAEKSDEVERAGYRGRGSPYASDLGHIWCKHIPGGRFQGPEFQARRISKPTDHHNAGSAWMAMVERACALATAFVRQLSAWQFVQIFIFRRLGVK